MKKQIKNLSHGWGIQELQEQMRPFLVRPIANPFNKQLRYLSLNCAQHEACWKLDAYLAEVATPVSIKNYGPCFGVFTKTHGEITICRDDLITFAELE